jgi:hypothetical protein
MLAAKVQEVVLTDAELMELIDEESRRRLNLDGEEFLRLWSEGRLGDSPAAREIGMLISLGKDPDPEAVRKRLRGVSERDTQSNGH